MPATTRQRKFKAESRHRGLQVGCQFVRCLRRRRQQVEADLGPVEVLVNNAGSYGRPARSTRWTLRALECRDQHRIWARLFNMTRQVMEGMRAPANSAASSTSPRSSGQKGAVPPGQLFRGEGRRYLASPKALARVGERAERPRGHHTVTVCGGLYRTSEWMRRCRTDSGWMMGHRSCSPDPRLRQVLGEPPMRSRRAGWRFSPPMTPGAITGSTSDHATVGQYMT